MGGKRKGIVEFYDFEINTHAVFRVLRSCVAYLQTDNLPKFIQFKTSMSTALLSTSMKGPYMMAAK
jgi:hypothetical protein